VKGDHLQVLEFIAIAVAGYFVARHFANAKAKGIPGALRSAWYVRNDGGRAAAGFPGTAQDCTTRAIAIATGLPYAQVHSGLEQAGASSADKPVPRSVEKRYLERLGWTWHPRQVPQLMSRAIVDVTGKPGHTLALRGGVVYDTFDSRNRGVLGYYSPPREVSRAA
jgi:hypothetical protein